ncbi:hypothetical protein SK128_023249 [Halocaridina rubra]|uniref:Uncharacterized protein n=1 Tax=Halocaridina rubra TaxID=373956 RepID=A0AAN9A1Z3_HALRR
MPKVRASRTVTSNSRILAFEEAHRKDFSVEEASLKDLLHWKKLTITGVYFWKPKVRASRTVTSNSRILAFEEDHRKDFSVEEASRKWSLSLEVRSSRVVTKSCIILETSNPRTLWLLKSIPVKDLLHWKKLVITGVYLWKPKVRASRTVTSNSRILAFEKAHRKDFSMEEESLKWGLSLEVRSSRVVTE